MSKKKKKYRVPITIQAMADKTVGYIECDGLVDYNKQLDAFMERGEYQDIAANVSNDFNIGDSEVVKVTKDDLKWYKNKLD